MASNHQRRFVHSLVAALSNCLMREVLHKNSAVNLLPSLRNDLRSFFIVVQSNRFIDNKTISEIVALNEPQRMRKLRARISLEMRIKIFFAFHEHAVSFDRKYSRLPLLRAVCLRNIFDYLESRSLQIAYRTCRHQAAWEQLGDTMNEAFRSCHVWSIAEVVARAQVASLTQRHQVENAINKSPAKHCNRRDNWTLRKIC